MTTPDELAALAKQYRLAGIKLKNEGRFQEAIELLQRALEITEKALGPNHLDVVAALNDLALLYEITDRFADAVRLYKRVMVITDKALDGDDDLCNLRLSLLFKEEDTRTRAEDIIKNRLLPDHPKVVLWRCNKLAEVYNNIGRYSDAEELYKKALEITEEIYGPVHGHVAYALVDLARLYVKTARIGQAELLYERALEISLKFFVIDRYPYHIDGKRYGTEAEYGLRNLAAQHKNEMNYAEAERLYKRVLEITEKTLGPVNQLGLPSHQRVVSALVDLASLYKETDRFTEAERMYKRAVEITEEIYGPDHIHVAEKLIHLARLYKETDRFTEEERMYKRAVEITEKIYGPDHVHVAEQLVHLARLYKETDRFTEAERMYKRAVEITEETYGPDHVHVAEQLVHLARLYKETDRFTEEERLDERAVKITEEIYGPDRARFAEQLVHLARLHKETDRFTEAERLFTKAESIYNRALETILDEDGQYSLTVAYLLGNLATLHEYTERYSEAEFRYQGALELLKVMQVSADDDLDVANWCNSLASIYHSTGRYTEAEPLYERALKITEKVLGSEHPAIAKQLNNIAVLYNAMERYVEAGPFYERALEITERALGSEHPDIPILKARILNNRAKLYDNTRRYDEAENLYKQALEITEDALGPDDLDIANWLNNLSSLYDSTGRYNEAEPLYYRALQIAEKYDDPNVLWKIQYGLSKLLLSMRRAEAAIFFGKQAVKTIQEMRANVAKMGSTVLLSYDHIIEHAFKHLAELLIDAGRFAEAEQTLNLLKQQEYFVFIRRDVRGEAASFRKVTFTSIEMPSHELYELKRKSLAEVADEKQSLSRKRERTEEENAHLAVLEKRIDDAMREFQEAIDRIRDELGTMNKSLRPEEKLEEAIGLQQDLWELGQGSVALYTVAGEKAFRILLIAPGCRKAFTKQVGEKELKRKIFSFRQALMPDGDRFFDPPRDLAKELYDIVLGPLMEELNYLGATTLMWSLEGTMRYLPVSALYDGNRYLVEVFRNVIFTPASHSRLKDNPKADWRGLGLGVTEPYKDFPKLSQVRQELLGIIRTQESPEAVFDGAVYVDKEFTWPTMQTALQEGPDFVHIASHYHMVPGNETDSFLLLGDGKRLPLEKIRYRESPLFRDVELLTLSACNTAMGNVGQEGGEVECLGVLAQRQGAKSVVATLWSVADVSTSLLMQDFYRQRLSGKSKAEALRQAQLGLLTGRLKAERVVQSERGGTSTSASSRLRYEHDPKAPFAHPYFWAPFILIGNWK